MSNDTIVKPDLLIVCDKINKKYLDFTPVLVLEILSAATASKDMGEKMELYASQKVKYYLIVDPQFKKIEIHQYTNQQYVLVSENTDNFTFVLENNCTSEISLLDIWE